MIIEYRTSPGLTAYEESLRSMAECVVQVQEGIRPGLVWFLEYPPLYTKGVGTQPQDLLNPSFPIYEASRGGRITYHGPGQRVAYVILDLAQYQRDIRLYVHFLEEWMIETLRHFKIEGVRHSGRIGVWVGSKKIGALGVKTQKWVTSYGISLNVSPDLSHYTYINPCGLDTYGVTSLQDLGIHVPMEKVDFVLKKTFEPLLQNILGE
jgi:lipoyl(octanoyl) transferase